MPLRINRAKDGTIVPSHAEHHTYNEYEVVPQIESRLIPGKMIDDEAHAYTICPVCKQPTKHVDHCEHVKCSCGLHIFVLGNGMWIWK